MADEEKKEEKKDEQKNDAEKKSSMMIWIVMLAVMIISAGAGIGIGPLFGGDVSQTEQTQPEKTEQVDPLEEITAKETDGKTGKKPQKSWYFDKLDSVIANLNEPGATRYVMVSLIIEMSPNVDQEKGTAFLQEKSYYIKDWLTIYFASLTLEDIQGDKNLKKIQNYICEILNEKLFPGAKPQIQHVLFKEFAIQ